jgi:hypothetical protein
MIQTIPGTSTQRQELHVIIDSPPNKDDKISPSMKKVLKVVACILIVLGISLMIGGSLFFGLGAAAGLGVMAAGVSAVLLASGPTMIPLGLTALLSGCRLFYVSQKESFSSKSLDIGDFLKA